MLRVPPNEHKKIKNFYHSSYTHEIFRIDEYKRKVKQDKP